MLLVAVDIGNTNVVIGFLDDGHIAGTYRITTKSNHTSDEYGLMITQFLRLSGYAPGDVDDVIISSVVPKVMHSFRASIVKFLNIDPMIVGPGVKTGINIRMDNPQNMGADCIAAIPPIYFHLPDRAVAKYWSDIASAAPNTDFIIYNIPQLAGTGLNSSLLRTMLSVPNVIGVKNSSMPIQDIEMWRDEGAIVFNGPDEQLLSGLAAGAVGGIGGTYAVMPELYERIYALVRAGDIIPARAIQDACCHIIYKMCSGQGNMYAMIKEILRLRGAPDIGSVRAPLYPLQPGDEVIAAACAADIDAAIAKFCE